MKAKGTIIGLSLLCALLFSAWATSNATAAEAEYATTAFTCKAQPQPAVDAEGFSDEHCASGTTGKNVKFEHVELTPKLGTEATATNSKTADSTKQSTEFLLTGKIAKLNGEIGCTTAHMQGRLGNLAGPPMQVYTEKIKMSLTGCTTKGFLGFTKCKLGKEEVWVKTPTSESITNTMEVEFTPEVPKKIAFFSIEGCPIEEEYEVEGTARAIAKGATLEFTKDSSGLTMEGAQASLTGQLTLRIEDLEGKLQDPISTTTKYVQ